MSESAAIVARYRRERRQAGLVATLAIALCAAWWAWAAWAGSMTSTARSSALDHAPANVKRSSADQSIAKPGPVAFSRHTAPMSGATVAPFNESVFQARLWVPPPRPIETLAAKPPEPPPAPPPPFKLRLVGLQRGATPDDLEALVYDAEAFKVTRVARGTAIGRYTLEAIDAAAGEAVFTDTQYPGKPQHTLKLVTLATPRTPLKIVDAPANAGGAP